MEIQRTKTGPFSITQQITSIVLNCLIFQSYLVEMVSHICKLGTCLGEYRLVQHDGVMVPSNNFMDWTMKNQSFTWQLSWEEEMIGLRSQCTLLNTSVSNGRTGVKQAEKDLKG